MLAAISFDLIGETEGLSQWELDLWMLVGVAVLLIGDRIVERRFGTSGTGGAMGIVVGSVVGGVPKSAIFGIQLATGLPVSGQLPHCRHRRQCAAGDRPIRRSRRRRMEGAATRSAVAPRGAGVRCRGSTGLPGRGSRKRYHRIPDSGLAAGGLLAMLTNSLMPFAYETWWRARRRRNCGRGLPLPEWDVNDAGVEVPPAR